MSGQNIVRLMDLGIKRLNSKEDFDVFQSFVTQELDLNTLYSTIDKKIDKEDGPELLEYILVAYSLKPNSQNIVEQLYDYVMNAINITIIPERMKVCLISRLSLNLYKLSTGQLIKFISMFQKDIKDSDETCMESWKKLIPQILRIISEIKLLRIEGHDITGAKYKEMLIIDICHINIPINITVPVAFILRRTELTEKEHDFVIKSLCLYFDEMKPHRIPALLQEIIHFSLSKDFLNIFCTLQKYFDDKYYSNRNNKLPTDAEQKELFEAQSAVLLILENFVKFHPSFLDVITTYIENCICAPNMVFGPFMLAFLLTLSCCEPYKANVISLVKNLVTQLFLEVENTQLSCWLKSTCTDIYDVYTEFQIFIKSDITVDEKVVKGLVDLGLSLLETISIHKKNENITNKVHQLGVFILVTLVNKRSFIIGSVLQTLTDFITCNPKSSQYIECLHLLCKNQKTDVVEKSNEFLSLFREISVGLTNKIISAVLPVLKFSTYLCDNVIMILRKELLSTDIQLRHCAVLGFVEILCSIHLDSFTSFNPTTGCQDSWPRLITYMVPNQNSLDIGATVYPENTFNNKSLCLEILDFLRTCFFQKTDIKQTLYRGLIRVISHNSGLCVYINNLISNHMHSWCIRVNDDKKSLKFDKSIIEDKHNNSISHEPLEDLILLAQHIITKNISYENNEECTDKLKILLGKLINFYSECSMDEIIVNENNHSLLDVMSNISHYSDIINQVLCVYQTFMVYIVNSWYSPIQDKEYCEKLHKLFFKYHRIVKAIEVSIKTNKSKPKTTYKYIAPFINLDFDILYKFLSLLITNVNCASSVTVAPLKQNARLWEFVLKLVQTYLSEIKSSILYDVNPHNMYENLCKLTKLLYNHFLFNINENLQFSLVVVELGIECYLQIIKFVCSHFKKLNTFLLDSDQQTSIDSSEKIFSVFCNIRLDLEKILEMNQANDFIFDFEDRVVYDKIECHLIGCVSVMCNEINQNHNAKIKHILIWLSTVIEKYSFSNLNNSKDFLTLMLDMHTMNQEDPTMLAILVKNLCFLFGHINSSQQANRLQQNSLKFITKFNKTMICNVLCQRLCDELNYPLLCLTRINAELRASQGEMNNTFQNRPELMEKAICHRMTLVILLMISFTKTVIPLDQCTESIFNLLFHIYHTVNIITKHFLVRSSLQKPVYKQALLGKLSEIINNQLTPNVSKFITFVEHNRLMNKEKTPVQLKPLTHRQTKCIPKIVTELELFVTLITKLGKKCKDQKLINSVKLISNRDFRLNVQKIQHLPSKQNNSKDSESELEEVSVGNQSNASKTVDEPPKKKCKFDSLASSSTSSRSTSPIF